MGKHLFYCPSPSGQGLFAFEGQRMRNLDFTIMHFHNCPLGSEGHPGISAPKSLLYGRVRLHDAGVSWAEIEKAPGQYDFMRFDAIVNAHPLHVTFIYTLSRTPVFHLQRPAEASIPDNYGVLGGSGVPQSAPAKAFIKAILQRYPSRINAVEIWNEPAYNAQGKPHVTWTGSAVENVLLGISIKQAISESQDPQLPKVDLWTPGLTGPPELAEFLAAGAFGAYGTRGKDIVDVVSWHAYCMTASFGYSSIISGDNGLNGIKRVCASAGMANPRFVVGEYGVAGASPDPRLTAFLASSPEAQYAHHMGLQVMAKAAGIEGIGWYAWDNGYMFSGDWRNVPALSQSINDFGMLLTQ